VPDALAPAIFVDRDGTIMRDVDYCGRPEDVEIFEGAVAALAELKARGYKIIIITNQSAIGRGYFDEAAYRAVQKEMLRQLGTNLIDATYFCPHTPEQNCPCRKPAPGMVLQAARDLALDLSRSYFIGDKESDMQCGRRAGTKTVLVETGYGKSANQESSDAVVPDLSAAVRFICSR
jgi:D-glycero-D-manno-heptose 1,7-bisphosphate phosphatase